MASLSPKQLTNLSDILAVGSVISLIGSLMVIFCYLKFHHLQKFTFKLVFFVALSDILFAIANLFGKPEPDTNECSIQAYLISFSELACLGWSTAIAFTLKQSVTDPGRSIASFERVFHIYSWGLPLLLTAFPSLSKSYGAAGPFCWITADGLGNFWRFLTFYVPLLCAILYNLYAFLVAHFALRGIGSSANRATYQTHGFHADNLLAFPIIMIACWVLPCANRLQNWVHPEAPSFTLYLLHVVTSSLQGCLHALAFISTRPVQKSLGLFLSGRPQPHSLRSPDLSEFELVASQGAPEGAEQETAILHGDEGELDDSVHMQGSPGRTLAPLSPDPMLPAHNLDESEGPGATLSEALWLQTLASHEALGVVLPEAEARQLQAHRIWRQSLLAAADPLLGPPPAPKAQASALVLQLSRLLIGGGVLFLPRAYANAGYVLATFGLVLSACFAYCAASLLLRAKQALVPPLVTRTALVQPALTTLHGLTNASCGAWGGKLARAVLAICVLSSCASGMLAAAQAFQDGFRGLSSKGDGADLVPLPKLVGILTLALCPLLVYRPLKLGYRLNNFGDLLGLLALGCVWLYYVASLPGLQAGDGEGSTTLDEVTLRAGNPSGFPLFFGLVISGLDAFAWLLPLAAAAPDPSEFQGALRVSLLNVCVFYIVFGSLGYVVIGESAQPSLTMDLPGHVVSGMLSVALGLAVALALPLRLLPVAVLVEPLCGSAGALSAGAPSPAHPSCCCSGVKILRAGLWLIAGLAAAHVPSLALWVNLVGGFVACTVAGLVPAGVYLLALKPDARSEGPSCRDRCQVALCVAFGVGLGSLAVWASVLGLMN